MSAYIDPADAERLERVAARRGVTRDEELSRIISEALDGAEPPSGPRSA